METTENTGAAAGLDVLKQQYETVSQALDYMGLVVAAVLVNYFTVFMQKERVLAAINGEEDPLAERDLFPFEITAAVMILSASSFFLGLSGEALENPVDDPVEGERLQLNNLINALVMLAAIVRIYNLAHLSPGPQTPQQEEENEIEEEETVL
ncbi:MULTISPECIES: hypothetical protein [Anaerotruncus]|jgi:hypothetical protein|uniref:hypothetical protein n=1 Tax=Anaerotruncus TaxID=244127 RepID=UPI000E4C7CE1|nr:MULTISPECIES: hypothetical protein [Anaerotruncus]RGX54884.1 hypothetical protein DWV16_11705 [Anaerotruncus sp. AF02-27]